MHEVGGEPGQGNITKTKGVEDFCNENVIDNIWRSLEVKEDRDGEWSRKGWEQFGGVERAEIRTDGRGWEAELEATAVNGPFNELREEEDGQHCNHPQQTSFISSSLSAYFYSVTDIRKESGNKVKSSITI